ncbi:MAG TPA: ABC transporter substrate-binding protein, partial [Geminicoccaceae bacterium]|nr:ABC transporter substrate-binding protein [Geminicoccaceae bacterium]
MPPVRFAASACFGLLLALAGCASPSVPPPAPAPQPPAAELPPAEPRIGLLLPLSGSAQPLGEDMLQAAQMALFDVGENELVLLPRDTRGTPDGAAAAARAVLSDGAGLIIGPVFSESVSAVAGVVRQHAAALPPAPPAPPFPGVGPPPS